MRGEDDRARVLGVILEEAVVEQLPRYGVEAQVRLVEEGERRPGCQPHDDSDGRDLAAGEFLDPSIERDAELTGKAGRVVGVPVREETTRRCAAHASA